MSHYRETLEYSWLDTNNQEIHDTLFSDWNSSTNIVTVWNKQGRVIYSGSDTEAKALSKLLTEKCDVITNIPNQE